MPTMSPRSVVLTAGVVVTAAIVALGLKLFPRSDWLMNLASEAAGVVAGGLVLFALVEAYLGFRKRREWLRVREALFERIHYELEILHFTVRPMASWHIARTLGEDIRGLIDTGPGDRPLKAGYFIHLVETLRGPLDSLNNNVTPRIVALADDEDLIRRLLDLEKAGLRLLVARHSLSEESPESSLFSKLINELLERAAAIGDCVDEKQFGDDPQEAAAQARFCRLYDFRLGSSWSSADRQMRLPDGSFYSPGT